MLVAKGDQAAKSVLFSIVVKGANDSDVDRGPERAGKAAKHRGEWQATPEASSKMPFQGRQWFRGCL